MKNTTLGGTKFENLEVTSFRDGYKLKLVNSERTLVVFATDEEQQAPENPQNIPLAEEEGIYEFLGMASPGNEPGLAKIPAPMKSGFTFCYALIQGQKSWQYVTVYLRVAS